MIKIAVMGFGTVGSGVVDVLNRNSDIIARHGDTEISVKYILDVRDFADSPWRHLLVKKFDVIEADPEVRIVVETIGGVGIAYEFTKRCLAAGKSVVTSNKELVAKKGHELLSLARKNNASYLFEASVGGGMPIIRPLIRCLAANRIDEIFGIMNGTTNYILTQMIECSESFGDALKGAQKNGFAEQDPTADIEGIDARNKIAILSALCFGRQVNPADVKTQGITDVSLRDVELAAAAGYKIKLLGRAIRVADEKIAAYVAPHLIASGELIASVSGVMNAIVVRGNAVGEAMFYGPGAGSLPTASAVVADVMDAVRQLDTKKYFCWEPEREGFAKDAGLIESRWFVRAAGAVQKSAAAFGEVHVIDDSAGETAFLTGMLSGDDIVRHRRGLDIKAVYRILD